MLVEVHADGLGRRAFLANLEVAEDDKLLRWPESGDPTLQLGRLIGTGDRGGTDEHLCAIGLLSADGHLLDTNRGRSTNARTCSPSMTMLR